MIHKKTIIEIKKAISKYSDLAVITALTERMTYALGELINEEPVEDSGVTVGNTKKSYPIKCSKCDKDTTVPFKPAENQVTPLLCMDCYKKKKDGEKR